MTRSHSQAVWVLQRAIDTLWLRLFPVALQCPGDHSDVSHPRVIQRGHRHYRLAGPLSLRVRHLRVGPGFARAYLDAGTELLLEGADDAWQGCAGAEDTIATDRFRVVKGRYAGRCVVVNWGISSRYGEVHAGWLKLPAPMVPLDKGSPDPAPSSDRWPPSVFIGPF